MSISQNRKKQLEKNFARMFWIRAFVSIKVINVVISLFYIHRGLSLSQIFYLAVIWSISSLLFEVPSSYLADRWGRKQTITISILLMASHWFLLLFVNGFFWISIATIFYGMSFAALSGTDEALVYDTEKELGKEKGTLIKLGRYKSAQSLFKIFAPLVAVLIAKNLLAWQYLVLLGIDFIVTLIALFFAANIIEPHHKMDLEKEEAGVMMDAVNLLRKDKELLRAILNKEILFFAMFIPWLYYQKFFIDLGLTIVFIGLFWGVRHTIAFFWHWYVGHIQVGESIGGRINRLNTFFTLTSGFAVLLLLVWPQPHTLYFLFIAMTLFEGFRFSLFSELFHKKFKSYNRATTYSLVNLLHSIIEIPLVIAAGILVALNNSYPYYLTFLLALIVIFFIRIKEKKTV